MILESSLDLFDCVSLDYVADLDVIVALDIKTAVHTHVNLLDIILESLERSEFSSVHNDTVADHAHLRCTGKLTFANDTSGNCTDLRNLECLLNLCSSGNNLLLLRLKHTLDTALKLIDTVVDD